MTDRSASGFTWRRPCRSRRRIRARSLRAAGVGGQRDGLRFRRPQRFRPGIQADAVAGQIPALPDLAGLAVDHDDDVLVVRRPGRSGVLGTAGDRDLRPLHPCWIDADPRISARPVRRPRGAPVLRLASRKADNGHGRNRNAPNLHGFPLARLAYCAPGWSPRPPGSDGSGRTQMLRKLIGGLGSPWACSLIGSGPCGL
jgi:hypothetical protein